MSRRRVDYDQFAQNYDCRYATGTALAGIERALGDLMKSLRPRRVLEVGCGTGRWLEALGGGSAALVCGIDASTGMLAQSRKRTGPPLVAAADANALPFPPASFDLIFCVNAAHHFREQEQFVPQAAWLLRPGGALSIIGMDPRRNRRRYYYDFFEGAWERDLARYPAFGQWLDWMSAAGFERADWRIVERSRARYPGREVLSEPFLPKHTQSILAQLTDEEYESGVARIEHAISEAEAAGQDIEFVAEVDFAAITGYLQACSGTAA